MGHAKDSGHQSSTQSRRSTATGEHTYQSPNVMNCAADLNAVREAVDATGLTRTQTRALARNTIGLSNKVGGAKRYSSFQAFFKSVIEVCRGGSNNAS